MQINDKFFYINIRDYLALGNDDKAGEPMLARVLSGFSCPKNQDVANFLKKNAVEFTKKSQSVTYLVFSVESKELLGYFTLALKPLSVRGETVSKTTKRKLLLLSFYRDNRFSQFDTRQTASDAEESHELVQLLRLL
jgi:hypothetical protein